MTNSTIRDYYYFSHMAEIDLNILLVNENLADAELVKLELKKMGMPSVDHALNNKEFLNCFVPGKYKAILCDFGVREVSGIDILSQVRLLDETIPFIFVLGNGGEEKAVEVLKHGATDYVLKSNLEKLSFVLQRAFKEEALIKAKKAAIRKLEENDQKYRSVADDQTEYIIRWLPNGKIVFVNKSYLDFHDSSEVEMLKKNFFDLVPKKEMERVQKKISSLKSNSPVCTDSHQGYRHERGFFWHEWTDRAFFDDKGTVTIYQSVGRDITDEKKAEIKLAENESRFRMLVENSFDIYSICDETGKIIYCSPNVKNILGYEVDEIVDTSVFNLFQKKVSNEAMNNFKELFFHSNKNHVFIHKILAANGTYRVFQTTGKIITKGKGERTVVFNSNDITEKQAVEKKLKESAEILNLIDSIVLVVEPDTNISFVSPSVKSILGFEPEELLGKMWWEKTTMGHVFMQREIDRVKGIFAHGLNEHNSYSERLLSTKDGQLKWIGWKKSMGLNGTQIGVGHDITSKKKAEHDLEESEKYLSTLIASIPDLLFRIDAEGKILDYKLNDGGSLSNSKVGSLMGLSYLKLIPKNCIEIHKQCAREALNSGKVVSYDFEIKMPQEKSLFFETRIKANALDELILIVRDITVKKEQESLIHENERKLNEAQKIAELGSWHFDLVNNVLDWSDETCRLFLVDPGTKMTLEQFFAFVHPSDLDYFKIQWAAALKSREYDFEHRIIVNQETKWVREIARLEFSDEGVVIGGVGIIQNITAKKLAEQELIRREVMLAFSHKLSKTGYYSLKDSKSVPFWSDELYALFEIDSEFIVPSFDLFLKLIHEDDFDRMKEFLENQKIKPYSFTIDYRIVTFSGTEKNVRETCEMVIDEGGEKTFIGVIQDVTETKDFEKALLQREKQIERSTKQSREIIETSDQFFYISKVNPPEISGNKIIFASPQVEEIFGVSPSEFISAISIWHQSIHPQDFPLVMEAAKELYKTKKPLTLIYRVKNRLSEQYCWVEDYACPHLDNTGEIIELYGSVKNIDERKKAEEELLKRESLLREAQRIAKLGMWEWNLDTDQILLSDEMFNILEISKETFGGKVKNLIELVSPESVARFTEALSNAVNRYKSEDVEVKIVTPNGNEKKLLIRGADQKDLSGPMNIVYGTLLDITEIWTSHEALFETEQKFKKIFESIDDIYFQADLIGICTTVSPSCINILGYEQEELVGKNIGFIYEFPEVRDALIGQVMEKGTVRNFETSYITKNGKRIFVSSNLSLRYDNEGKVLGTQGITRDISEKKKNELEREKLLLELTNKYNQLMQFNYIVSHNLRSPITNLLGLTNMFEPSTDAKEQKEIIKHIQNSALSMDGLVKDLNMILATQTAINEHKEDLSLINVIETIKNNLHTQIVESSAMIISDIASDNDTLYTIKSYLQSILYNLVSNSIKYRSDNRNPIIRISCIKQKESTVISVVDNGNGIDLAMFQKQLFGLYKRFDLSKEGRGLGLHMTKTQVEALGGEIKVESELGKGTTFTITLPN